MPSRDPATRRKVAKIAALERWAHEDPKANAERGQAGLRAKFEREVDPDGVLPVNERLRRADCAYRAHMIRIRLRTPEREAA